MSVEFPLEVAEACAGRPLHTVAMAVDFVVVGGGLAGVSAAISAAREGLKVVLVQDRPVLGGNASSEVRLWVLGASTHMGSNNRWAREGGIVGEILEENLFRNPDGNAVIFDSIVLEKVISEPNLTLLLNTAAYEVEKDGDRIAAVTAFCSQNSTRYHLKAPLFCDASGDGIVGFLAGAAFRMGAESREEFGEPFAPDPGFGALLGHSIYFYTKDVGRPIRYVAPSFALKNIPGKIPRYRQFNAREHGCNLWWIEWGGRLHTVHETEAIKWELWKIVYGVWDHIKNSGDFPEAETLTLEWVGMIPGKRESRRFEGDYILRQEDVVFRRPHEDIVAHGGWSIDLHPADGVYAERAGSHHLYFKGPYGIPYRCYYSRNVTNLFLAGRIISASHVAFGSIRVMGTGAVGGQAVGTAAALCHETGVLPRDILESSLLQALRVRLSRRGQHMPGFLLKDAGDLIGQGTLTASSEYELEALPADGPEVSLEHCDRVQMIPLTPGRGLTVTLTVRASEAGTLGVRLLRASASDHHTPDVELGRMTVPIPAAGKREITLPFPDLNQSADGYVFLLLEKNPHVSVRCSTARLTGVLTLHSSREGHFSSVGGEDFQFYVPDRRPGGHNFAFRLGAPMRVFGRERVLNGVYRPTTGPNCWCPVPDDTLPSLTCTWDKPVTVRRVELHFDGDFDHAMESVLRGHPENIGPFCVRNANVRDDAGRIVAEIRENRNSQVNLTLSEPVETRSLVLEICDSAGESTRSVFGFRAYGEAREPIRNLTSALKS